MSKVDGRYAAAAAAAHSESICASSLISPDSLIADEGKSLKLNAQSSTMVKDEAQSSTTEKDEDQSSINLPEEIIVAEIIPRLHIKPLSKFKCVSKQYNSIISHPSFGRNYLQRAYNTSPELSGLLTSRLLYPHTDLSPYRDHFSNDIMDLTEAINSNQDQLTSISVNSVSIPYNDRQQIVASSNGLILSRFNPNEGMEGVHNLKFVLCVSNPLTKQCRKLPNPKMRLYSQLHFGIATRHDDSAAFLTYKVVTVLRWFVLNLLLDSPESSVQIFSSDTGSWAYWKPTFPGESFYEFPDAGPFSYQGVLYWLDRKVGRVVTYNPYDSPDRFGQICLPNGKFSFSNSSLIYSGEEERVKYCEIEDCGLGVDRLSVWGLVDGFKWCLEREFRVQSLVYDCGSIMVAPNPWNRDVICHPYVMGDHFTVINLQTGTRMMVDVFKRNNHPPDFQHEFTIFRNQLIPIELCPWSSPFYAQTPSI